MIPVRQNVERTEGEREKNFPQHRENLICNNMSYVNTNLADLHLEDHLQAEEQQAAPPPASCVFA
jgi:hypothetical protein